MESQLFFKSESEEDDLEDAAELPQVAEESNQVGVLDGEPSATTSTHLPEPDPAVLEDVPDQLPLPIDHPIEPDTICETVVAEPPAAPPIHIDYNFEEAIVAKPVSSKLALLKERIRANVQPNISPSLKGSSNTIIDLDTGDVLPGQNAGRDELFERFLKHKAKPAKQQPRDLRCAIRMSL